MFHADPHPDNICLSKGKIVFLDWGMVGNISKKNKNLLSDCMKGIIYEDYDRVSDDLLSMSVKSGEFSYDKLVKDVKTLKLKIHPQEESKYNSPWNIAVDFQIDMSFGVQDIEGMLREYEQEYQAGIKIPETAQLLYDYTAGYPYLVSKICQLVDERISGTKEFPNKIDAWKKEGILSAIKVLLKEPNTLFDDMTKKLLDYPQLKEMLQNILFSGIDFPFKREMPLINLGVTFGFLKDRDGIVAVSNRIFETQLYDMFLAEMAVNNKLYMETSSNRNQFIISDMLQMDIVMKKFYEYYEEIYADNDQKL